MGTEQFGNEKQLLNKYDVSFLWDRPVSLVSWLCAPANLLLCPAAQGFQISTLKIVCFSLREPVFVQFLDGSREHRWLRYWAIGFRGNSGLHTVWKVSKNYIVEDPFPYLYLPTTKFCRDSNKPVLESHFNFCQALFLATIWMSVPTKTHIEI